MTPSAKQEPVLKKISKNQEKSQKIEGSRQTEERMQENH
jgi:hypothetical protein